MKVVGEHYDAFAHSEVPADVRKVGGDWSEKIRDGDGDDKIVPLRKPK